MSRRNVETDPRVGDLVCVVPLDGREVEPTPLRIVEVDARWIHWERNGVRLRTTREFWRGERAAGVKCLRLELVDESQQAAA
jgi:hypothetical protein